MQQIGHKATDTDIQIIVNLLRNGVLSLSELIAGFNRISDIGADAIAQLLPRSEIAYLQLNDNDIGKAGARALVDAIKQTPSLRSLNLDGSPIEDDGGKAVAELIESCPHLIQLSVARCELKTDAIIAISTALQSAPNLRHLDISEPRLFSRNEETTYHIAKALRSNKSLQSLALRKHPQLTDSGVASICDYLLDNDTLQELDLSANRIGPPSGTTIAATLEAGSSLRVLLLSNCRIGDEGAVAIGRVLAAGATRLEVLDVRSNDIGDVGIAALAEALSSPNCPLRELKVWGNDKGLRPGSSGATALGSVLLSGAVEGRISVDSRAYEADGEVMVAQV